jgi:hypothetical protein
MAVLYHPTWQSPLFLELTPQRDVALSVIGLIFLSGLHGALFARLEPSIPGHSWLGKGLFWGTTIWLTYWLFQEWFIYVTLLREPVLLALFELAILLGGSLVEGVVIARLASGSVSSDARHRPDLANSEQANRQTEVVPLVRTESPLG